MLNSSLLTLILATPSPSPTASDGSAMTYESYGPGALGFVATAFMVTLTILLMRNMSRKLRRVRYAEQVREEFEGAAASSSEDPARPTTL